MKKINFLTGNQKPNRIRISGFMEFNDPDPNPNLQKKSGSDIRSGFSDKISVFSDFLKLDTGWENRIIHFSDFYAHP